MMNMRDNGTVPKFDPVTGDVNWVDERTEAIVTYALCGFANFGSIGIMLGGLGGWLNLAVPFRTGFGVVQKRGFCTV